MSSFKGRLSTSPRTRRCWERVSRMTRPLKTYWHLAGARRDADRVRDRDARSCSTTSGAASRCDVPLGRLVRAPPDAARRCACARLGALRRSARDDLREVRDAAARPRRRTSTGCSRSIEDGDYDARLDAGLGRRCSSACCRRCATRCTGCRWSRPTSARWRRAGASRSRRCSRPPTRCAAIQRLAYRMAQLRRSRPSFGDDGARSCGRRDPAWQPLRELIERLLVTYDWGEAFVGAQPRPRSRCSTVLPGRRRRRRRAPGATTCWARSSSRWARTAPGTGPGREALVRAGGRPPMPATASRLAGWATSRGPRGRDGGGRPAGARAAGWTP